MWNKSTINQSKKKEEKKGTSAQSTKGEAHEMEPKKAKTYVVHDMIV